MQNSQISKKLISKVPEVTLGFWFIKMIATTLGELGGNAVSLTLNMGYLLGSILFGIPLIITIITQIKIKKFNYKLYWMAITLTTLAGTTLADFFDRSLGIGYLGGSISLLLLVLLSLLLWYRILGSINIKTVVTPKAEAFYWTTIMFSQTLGTALGDWMADSTPLGYNGSALFITALLIIVAMMYFYTKISRTFLFWSAFILTRPLGATLANSLDKPLLKGGLGINDITLSAIFFIFMIISLYLIPQKSGSH